MPRNSFPLAVRVSREINVVALFGFLFYLFDYRLFVLDIYIMRLEIVFDVYAQL